MLLSSLCEQTDKIRDFNKYSELVLILSNSGLRFQTIYRVMRHSTQRFYLSFFRQLRIVMGVKIKGINKVYGISSPWSISEVTADHDAEEAHIHVICTDESKLRCPKCDQASPVYDRRTRSWRHLDTGKYRTIVTTQLPRVKCAEHGVVTISPPWADRSVRMTYEFEALVIDLLRESTISSVCRLLQMSWPAVAGIMDRAVERGLDRRKAQPVAHVCVDETSYKKGHKYITVVSDSQTGTVLFVKEKRTHASLDAYYEGCSTEQLEAIESVSMDMWPAYIKSTKKHVPDAASKIAFDRFHVAKKIGGAVDKVRRQENRELRKAGIDDLTGTKYDWLTNKQNMSVRQKKRFKALKDSSLKTARAWAIKELSQKLWHYKSRTWARKAWEKWLSWASRCRLEDMVKVAKTVRKHLWGILNAIILKASNGPAESINSRIKTIKVRCRGFRNTKRLANAIYFYLGGLDLYPNAVSKTRVSLN